MRSLKQFLLGCLALVAALASVATAQAAPDRRVALVIGNGAYTVAPALSNPVTDAKAVAAALKRLGFEVVEGYDLTFAGMRGKLGEFSTALNDSQAGLVYYAGHGVSVDEENYLLPTDIALKSASDLDLNSMNLSLILRQMKREERVNIVILDACRDNPFARELATGRGRSIVAERGLSRVDNDLAKGTLIAFATDPKSTALDGRAGENSPFTRALLRHLESPGVSIDTVMNRVRAEVWEATKNKQMPWVNTSIIGEFILRPVAQAPQQVAGLDAAPPAAAVTPPPAVVADRVMMEARFWESAERGNTADDYRAYLDAYPNGIYAQMAKARVARLAPAPAADAPKPVAAVPAPAAVKPADKPVETAALEQRGDVAKPADAAPAAQVAAVPATDPALKAEVGTLVTEQAMKLTKAARVEIQARLKAMQFDAGPENGKFAEKTRAALAEWQKSRELQATGWLAPLQLAALNAQSESPYQRAKEAQRMTPASVKDAASEATRKVSRPAARPAPAVAPGVRQARRERIIRAQNEDRYVRDAAPPASRRGHRGPPPPGGDAGPGIGAFIGGVAAGAILGGAFRRH